MLWKRGSRQTDGRVDDIHAIRIASLGGRKTDQLIIIKLMDRLSQCILPLCTARIAAESFSIFEIVQHVSVGRIFAVDDIGSENKRMIGFSSFFQKSMQTS